MSEIRPKRAAREPTRGEAVPTEVTAAATVPVVAGNTAAQQEPDASTTLAPIVPAGPACPVPAEPEHPPFDNRTHDETREAAAEDPWTAFAEAQSALARGLEKMAVEATGISRSGMVATTDAAVALLGARTVAEALEINAGLVRRGIDAMMEGTARLSEIGAQALADASRPFLSRMGWS